VRDYPCALSSRVHCDRDYRTCDFVSVRSRIATRLDVPSVPCELVAVRHGVRGGQARVGSIHAHHIARRYCSTVSPPRMAVTASRTLGRVGMSWSPRPTFRPLSGNQSLFWPWSGHSQTWAWRIRLQGRAQREKQQGVSWFFPFPMSTRETKDSSGSRVRRTSKTRLKQMT
jgi:hypothetical protein